MPNLPGHRDRDRADNNALVFPGLGLGVTAARAARVTDGMLAAAADAVAQLSDATRPGTALLPPVDNLRCGPDPAGAPGDVASAVPADRADLRWSPTNGR